MVKVGGGCGNGVVGYKLCVCCVCVDHMKDVRFLNILYKAGDGEDV